MFMKTALIGSTMERNSTARMSSVLMITTAAERGNSAEMVSTTSTISAAPPPMSASTPSGGVIALGSPAPSASGRAARSSATSARDSGRFGP